ncbi:MAG TPA: hypothetical protein VKT77_12495 [Chthonomonadaceae bacterium]|nr:hypothetical protein [Chthonomonadaceae bacterium]
MKTTIRTRKWGRVWPIGSSSGALVAAVGLIGGSASAQSIAPQRLSPDLLQTLGVGSRSIAMGGAYTAVADDISATYWNPGRLGYLTRREFMIEYRPVVASNFNSMVLPTGTTASTGVHPGNPQVGFVGLTLPLSTQRYDKTKPGSADRVRADLGTIGVSYTLGGYFSLHSTSQLIAPGLDANNNPVNNDQATTTDQFVRNSFISVVYGTRFAVRRKAPAREFGIGVGFFVVNQEFSSKIAQSSFQQATKPNSPKIPIGIPLLPTDVSAHGGGVGGSVGVSYQGVSNDGSSTSPFSFGMSYRSKAKLSGFNQPLAESFNDEIPDRLNVGMAYTADLKGAHSGTLKHASVLRTAVEVQFQSAANRRRDSAGNLSQTDQRRAVADLHLGLEWVPRLDTSVRTPIRMGFRTVSNAATVYTYYDNIFSIGAAYQSRSEGALVFSIEPTAEILTSNGLTQYTITGRIQF